AVLAGAGDGAALPGDDEIAGRVHAHSRELLVAGGELVDLELPAQRRPGGAVAAGVDVVRAGCAGLAVARPGDDEIAGRVHRHGREPLVTRGEGVGPGLRAAGGVRLDVEGDAEGAAGGAVEVAVEGAAVRVEDRRQRRQGVARVVEGGRGRQRQRRLVLVG